MNRKYFLIASSFTIAVLLPCMIFASAPSFAGSPAFCSDYAKNYANLYAGPSEKAQGSVPEGLAPDALFGGNAGSGKSGQGDAGDWSFLYSRAYDRCLRGL